MYKAYLSYKRAKEYVIMLEENGLLARDETSMTFRTTSKGYQLLEAYNRLNELSGLAIVDGISRAGHLHFTFGKDSIADKMKKLGLMPVTIWLSFVSLDLF